MALKTQAECGKLDAARQFMLAYYGIRLARSGRKLGMTSNSNAVSSNVPGEAGY